MDWAELFSFKGRVGRGRLLGVWLAAGIGGEILIGVAAIARELILRHHGGGVSTAPTPSALPAVVGSWVLIVITYMLRAVLLWVWIATVVKRQHDRGRSGKWAAYFLAALAAILALGNIAQRQSSLSFLEIYLVFLSLIVIVGALGMVEMLFAPGVPAEVEPGDKAGAGV